MLALAGHPLDIRCTTLDPARDSPASQVAPSIVGRYDDRRGAGPARRRRRRRHVRVRERARRGRALPDGAGAGLPARGGARDRAGPREREAAVRRGRVCRPPRTNRWRRRTSSAPAVERIGTPAVLKTRRLGYDGKGQAVIHDAVLAEDAWRAIGEVPAILERLVAFDRELSIVSVRGRDGAVALLSARREPPSRRDPPPLDRPRAGSDAPVSRSRPSRWRAP